MSTVSVPADKAFSAVMHAQVWLEETRWRRLTTPMRQWRTQRLMRVTELACILGVDVTLNQQDVRDIGYWLRGGV